MLQSSEKLEQHMMVIMITNEGLVYFGIYILTTGSNFNKEAVVCHRSESLTH